MEKQFIIHMTKEPMIKAYCKILRQKKKTTGIKPCDNYNRKARELMCYYTSGTIGGLIFDATGDVLINYNVCVKYHKKQGYNDVYGQIISIISHELFHFILLRDESEEENSAWDVIAGKLEKEGYLGGI